MLMLEYLTVEEVAKQLRVSQDTILRAIRRKDLVAYKLGGKWQVTPDDLKKWVDTRKNKPTQES